MQRGQKWQGECLRQADETSEYNGEQQQRHQIQIAKKMKIQPIARNSLKSQQAYTIAEVIMGSAVMGVMLVGLFGGMTSGWAFTQLAREDLRATQIMVEKMEEVRLYSWSQINGSNGYVIPPSFNTSYYPPGLGNSSGITYTGQLSILPANLGGASYSNAMRLIKVNLQWQSGRAPHSRAMSTYVGSNGIQNYVYN